MKKQLYHYWLNLIEEVMILHVLKTPLLTLDKNILKQTYCTFLQEIYK